jgi:hypothetical protein
VRDFSSLGKSTRSPFRNGETPVLPMNLVCRWPEYRVMEEGDVVLTVEHCCHCAEHELITHHKEEQYVQVSDKNSTHSAMYCVSVVSNAYCLLPEYSLQSTCETRCRPQR